jgi:hypothetical protein
MGTRTLDVCPEPVSQTGGDCNARALLSASIPMAPGPVTQHPSEVARSGPPGEMEPRKGER